MADTPNRNGEDSKPVLVPYKRSQRPSWSCTECARRKIKCDKKVPCQSCVKRGRAEQCRLEGSPLESAGPSSLRGLKTPEEQSDDGRPAEESPLPSGSLRRFSNGAGAPAEPRLGGLDDTLFRGLSRLQQQLDRIERRLEYQSKQDDSIEDVKARLNDVEDVISALGERRDAWKEPASDLIPPNAAMYSDRTANDLRRSDRPAASSTQSGKLDGVARNPSEGATSLARGADIRMPVTEPQERNAELASTDAATTLEFLTLGKDRRRDLDFDASSSDTDADASHPYPLETTADASQRPMFSSSGIVHTHQAGKDGRMLAADGNLDPGLRMLKHLRRGLPSFVVAQIEALLRSHPDELPPANLLARPAIKPVTDGIKAAKLSPSAIRGIVGIAKEIGAWQHCCVHFPTFEREVEAFLAIAVSGSLKGQGSDFEGFRAIDPAWLSLFYVLCSIAVHQMSEEEGSHCGVGAEVERMQLASIMLHAAMESLSLADYLVKPSAYCCQTIAILCVAGHNICGSDLLTSLLAIGIKTGQTLGLHALGRSARFLEACAAQRSQVLKRAGIQCDDSGSCRLPDESPRQFAIWRKRIIDLEVGKRVWWAFTQQDYFAIPFSGCFSIVEGQYDTPLPHNCSDEDLEEGRLINREVNVLTVASKQRFTCHVAKIVCDFFEDLNKARGVPSLSLVRHHEARLRFVTDRFKACLDPTRSASGPGSHGSLPSFTTVLQHYLFISVQHKILVMHRAFLSRDVSEHEREQSHSASIETARAVLHELERGLGLNADDDDRPQLDLQSRVHGGALWTIPYHSVAAATILALDMFKPASHAPHRAKRRHEVKRALEALGRFTRKSAIARRGCQLLADLLEEGERYDQRPRESRKRKATDGVDSVLKRIRLPEGEGDSPQMPDAESRTDMPSSARSPQEHAVNPALAHARTEKALEASWFSHFNHASVRSDVSSALAEGTSPDAERGGLLPAASFGYGSSNFNPLAGNSTSRAGKNASFHPSDATNSLSSMFMSYASPGGINDPFSALNGHRTTNGEDGRGPARRLDLPVTGDFSSPMPTWPTNQPDASLENGMQGNIPGMNLNMPQQQLAHILPALESMPDVWKLFDGTLGQNLVAFEESGF